MKTTNSKSRQFVERLDEFEANNLSARKEGKFYIVYSYGWYPLLAYSYENKKWFENANKYSVSTSKHLTQCRPNEETLSLSLEGLKDLIQGR